MDMHFNMSFSEKIKCKVFIKFSEKLKDIKRRNGISTDLDQGNESNMMVPLRRNQESEFER